MNEKEGTAIPREASRVHKIRHAMRSGVEERKEKKEKESNEGKDRRWQISFVITIPRETSHRNSENIGT